MRGRGLDLPEVSRDYIAHNDRSFGRDIVIGFHRWMRRENVSLGELCIDDIERFLEKPFKTVLQQGTRNG